MAHDGTTCARASQGRATWGGKYPTIQLLTIAEILAGKGIDYPARDHLNVTFKQAPRVKGQQGRQPELFEE